MAIGNTSDQFLSMLADRIADEVAVKVADKLKKQFAGGEKLLFSLEEAAARMGLSRSTMKNMIREREIACVRRGTRVLIYRADFDAWVANNRT